MGYKHTSNMIGICAAKAPFARRLGNVSAKKPMEQTIQKQDNKANDVEPLKKPLDAHGRTFRYKIFG
jgi:hypothetical protein